MKSPEILPGDAELFTGDPRWYIFLPGLSSLAFIFAEVEAGEALSRDVITWTAIDASSIF